MSKVDRITPEMIKEAVEKNGIPLVRGMWVVLDEEKQNAKCCCAISQYCLANGLVDSPVKLKGKMTRSFGELTGLGYHYLTGFIEAFDGYSSRRYVHYDNEEAERYNQGYEDGLRVKDELGDMVRSSREFRE